MTNATIARPQILLIAAVAENGVIVEADCDGPNGGRSIYFRDPSGNSIECAEPLIWGMA